MKHIKEVLAQLGVQEEDLGLKDQYCMSGQVYSSIRSTIEELLAALEVFSQEAAASGKYPFEFFTDIGKWSGHLSYLQEVLYDSVKKVGAIKKLAQGLGLSQEDIEGFEFDFEQLEEPGLTQQMTAEEWERFQYYQQNPPQTPEEQAEYQMLWEKAQQAVSASKRPMRAAVKLVGEVSRYDIVDELYRAEEMVRRSIDIAETAENVAWDVAGSLSAIEQSIKNTRAMLDIIQKERVT
jgi:hypothetical protein